MKGDREAAALHNALDDYLRVYLDDEFDIELAEDNIMAFLDDEVADAENRDKRRER